MKKNNIYILGAGASKSDGLPLTNEIIDQAFWNFGGDFEGQGADKLIGSWDKEDEVAIIRPVFKLFDEIYSTSLSNILTEYYKTGYHPHDLGLNTNMIEGFFSKLYLMSKGIENYGLNYSPEEIISLDKKAKFLFFHTLAYEAIAHSPKNYIKFIERVLRREGRHHIISFNYDLLLEDALIHDYLKFTRNRWDYPEDLKWTYGLDFERVDNVPYDFPPLEEAKIVYLKLHGSLNWGYNSVNQRVYLRALHADAFIYNRFYQEAERYDGTGELMEPILIPPINNKQIEITALKTLWEKANELPEHINELHIIGYSLPEIDQEAKNLLLGVARKRIEELVIVNPNKEHASKYQRMFTGISNVVFYNNFIDYLESRT